MRAWVAFLLLVLAVVWGLMPPRPIPPAPGLSCPFPASGPELPAWSPGSVPAKLRAWGGAGLRGVDPAHAGGLLSWAAAEFSAPSALKVEVSSDRPDILVLSSPLSGGISGVVEPVPARRPDGRPALVWLDSGRSWDEETAKSAYLHFIGHALGLGHTSDPDSVMGPSGSRSLSASDAAALVALYGRDEPPPPDGPPAPLADREPVPVRAHALDDGTWYGTTMSRASRSVTRFNKVINIHETNHMVHADERNSRNSGGSPRVGAFHYGDGMAAIVREPRVTLESVAARVPPALRGYRFKTYLIDQRKDWGAKGLSLYIFDEAWCYYVDSVESIGSRAAGFDPPRGRGWSNMPAPAHQEVVSAEGSAADPQYDGVSSCLEFSIYAVAHYLATAEEDPGFINENPNYLKMVKDFLRMSREAWRLGAADARFSGLTQSRLLDALKTHPDAAPHREALRDVFGGLWLD